MFLKLKYGISTIIMGETGVGKTCLVRYLSQMIQSSVFTLDVHAGRSQKDIIKWMKRIIDLSKFDYKQLNEEYCNIMKDINEEN